ncbi:MAG: regulatory iron-sulfur-containing complex subunit RicT [Rhodothermales bacterium]|nr:regulatory iron-sulfur-containing complex subunit RicT [Rhodothermales bacterium]
MHVFDWLNDLGIGGDPVEYDVLEVVFKGGRKGFFRNARSIDIQTGDRVIVDADRGIDFGTIHMSGELVRLRFNAMEAAGKKDIPTIIRRATLSDLERWEDNREKEAESFLIARSAIDRRNLPMKLVDVEWQFDHKKVTFYFTADNRVDFRELVRDLAREFHTRVELRQIGARDEAARIGGIGSCGRELCCSTWLQEFQPVTTNAAKVQNLPLNPARLSGQCGRLKCCLNYELELYMGALRRFPKLETAVRTDHGTGRVRKIDIFKDVVWICHADGTWEDLQLSDVRRRLGLKRGETVAKPDNYDPETVAPS